MPLWKTRPEELKQTIAYAFERLKSSTTKWGLCNGSTEYAIACVNTFKLLKSQIEKSPEQKIFNIMDIGAGNGSAGRHLAIELNKDGSIPADVKINIFNIRAEQNLYKLQFHSQMDKCDIYECSGFNAENLIDELARIGHGDKQFDIIMSRWCMRHLVDPVGTFEQVYSITRPESGFIMMDGFWYQLSGHPKCYESGQSNNQIISILLDTHSQFLLHPYDAGRSFDQFVLKKNSEELVLPLEYTSERSYHWGLQAGKHESMTILKEMGDTSVKWVKHGEINYNARRYLWGDETLYKDMEPYFEIGGWYKNSPSYTGHFEREDVSLVAAVAALNVGDVPFCE